MAIKKAIARAIERKDKQAAELRLQKLLHDAADEWALAMVLGTIGGNLLMIAGATEGGTVDPEGCPLNHHEASM